MSFKDCLMLATPQPLDNCYNAVSAAKASLHLTRSFLWVSGLEIQRPACGSTHVRVWSTIAAPSDPLTALCCLLASVT